MEPKCLQTPGNIHSSLLQDTTNSIQLEQLASVNVGINGGAIYNHIDLNNSLMHDNSVFKDDDSGSGSSEDALRAHQNLLGLNSINKDPENVGIYLETPIIDESNICLVGHDYDKGNPKRLSDEFLSSDHIDDESLSLQTPLNNINQNNNIELHLTDDNASGNFLPISDSNIYLVEDDTNSYCSNLLDDKDESQFDKSSLGNNVVVHNNYEINSARNALCNEYSIAGTSSISSTCSIFDKNMQSMDAIERRDFEHEQRLTGGRLMRTKAIMGSENKLKLEFVKAYQENNGGRAVSSDSKCTYKHNHHSTTPTSSRNNTSRLTKSTAKLNLASSLNYVNHHDTIEQQIDYEDINANDDIRMQQPCSSKSLRRDLDSSKLQLSEHPKVISLRAEGSNKHFDLFSSSNSNDSLSSEKSCSTSSNHSLPKCLNKPGCSGVGNGSSNIDSNNHNIITKIKSEIPDEDDDIKLVLVEVSKKDNNTVVMGIIPEQNASTSSECNKYSTSRLCCRSADHNDQLCETNRGYDPNKLFVDQLKNLVKRNSNANANTSQRQVNLCNDICRNLAASKCFDRTDQLRPMDVNVPHNNHQLDIENNRRFADQNPASVLIALEADPNENDFDEETWGDCEDASDEEKCTCFNSNDNELICGPRDDILDNFPLSDSDLSNCIQMVSLSEDILIQENNMLSPVNLHRKRKLNENGRLMDASDILSPCSELSSGRKRLALDTTPKRCALSVSSSPSTPYGRRLLIPTRENPPPELPNWLIQFQRWSNAERLLALDRLIEHCEPTQVRHMMKVIEPQFQRDFISLLPKELALQVLSYLEPADLLRAAQTCISWRFLCDDNLLWKEKCRKAQILLDPKTGLPKRGRAGNMPPISSLWKAAYMRQHIIEMNWRSRPIRDPKILKGHDDHVITCLQFSGNRIVSGSDDNTLKVWSAVTGRCLRTLVGHTGGVWSSQMTGDIIVSGSTDRTLKVWHMDTGHCVHTLQGHTSTVRCMHLHGKKVVSGSRDATLRVWDIEMGTCLHVLVGHLAAVRCVQYDGRLIVSGAYDYTVKIWHPERQECLHTLQGHTNRVYSLQFDGIHVVSGSLDTSIRVWDAETGNCKHTLMGHQSLTSGMELRQNILVSGNADSTVKVWDITSGQCLQTLSGSNKHQSAVTCLQFNSRFVITSSDDGTVKLWDVKTGEFIRNLVALDSGGSGGVVWRIRANDTKLICAVGSRNGTEETKLMVLDFDVEGACVKCS